MSESHAEARRLGKRELGSYAFEQQMPARIARAIETESPRNKCHSVIPNLAKLLERDRNVEVAYLCHESVIQISKLRNEGSHFCGYRNIQMLLPEQHAVYSITQLQEMIEQAWDQGFNSHGRVETGGVKGTRKHIGTSEVQALFQSLKIPCNATTFSPPNAHIGLLDSVEKYFAMHSSSSDRIRHTKASPIFLQRPNHSLTIVGIERDGNGRRKLLVFDPAYQIPSAMKNGKDLTKKSTLRDRLILYQYRRDERYLKRYSAFETLSLSTTGLPV